MQTKASIIIKKAIAYFQGKTANTVEQAKVEIQDKVAWVLEELDSDDDLEDWEEAVAGIADMVINKIEFQLAKVEEEAVDTAIGQLKRECGPLLEKGKEHLSINLGDAFNELMDEIINLRDEAIKTALKTR